MARSRNTLRQPHVTVVSAVTSETMAVPWNSAAAIPKVVCSVLLRLHRSVKVSIGLDEASCPEAGGSRPGYASALGAQRCSDPGNKITTWISRVVSIYLATYVLALGS